MRDPGDRSKMREGGRRPQNTQSAPKGAGIGGGKACADTPDTRHSTDTDPSLDSERSFLRLFVGTRTEVPSDGPGGSASSQRIQTSSLGIYSLSLSLKSGFVSADHTVMSNPNPTFLAKRDRMLVAAHEIAGKAKAAVYAAHDDGSIEHISTIADKSGARCCHIALHPNGRWAYGPNYESGSLSCWPLRLDGSLGPLHARVRHEGCGPNRCRQKSPHICSSYFVGEGTTLDSGRSEGISPKAGKTKKKPPINSTSLLAAVDLGADRIVLYEAPANEGLRPEPIATIPTPAGFGPRAIALRPGYPNQLAVIGELANSAIVYDTGSSQNMQESMPDGLQNIMRAQLSERPPSSLPQINQLHQDGKPREPPPVDDTAPETTPEIAPAAPTWHELSRFDLPSCCGIRSLASHAQLSPCGRRLYVSVRGKNIIAVYELDEHAKVVSQGRFPCGGEDPRHFELSPCGRYLAVANQGSNNVVVFRAPKPADEAMEEICRIDIPSPTCVIWG